MPVVIALHARWGERAQELPRSTSLDVVIRSVIRHFENVPLRCTVEVCHSAPTSHSSSPSSPSSLLASSSLSAPVSSLRSTALTVHANVLWYDSHVSAWLRTTKRVSVFTLSPGPALPASAGLDTSAPRPSSRHLRVLRALCVLCEIFRDSALRRGKTAKPPNLNCTAGRRSLSSRCTPNPVIRCN